jgi:polysaccharide pyruvyl transferase WcaK-like protein
MQRLQLHTSYTTSQLHSQRRRHGAFALLVTAINRAVLQCLQASILLSALNTHNQTRCAAVPAGKPLNYAFSGYATTIFEVMSKLAAEHQSVNLGQVRLGAWAVPVCCTAWTLLSQWRQQ